MLRPPALSPPSRTSRSRRSSARTAQKAAEAGVPLSELLPNAPDIYTVKRGDTLWGISKLYLKSPWRWPELWGMNLEQVRNPHLIFPGQVLFLDKSNGRARLRMGAPVGGAGDAGLSPRVRSQGHRARRHRLDPVQPDRAVPQRGGDLRDQRARRRAAHRRHAGRPRAAVARRHRLRARRPRPRARVPHLPRAAAAEATRPPRRSSATRRPTSAPPSTRSQGETRTNADGKAEIIPATFTRHQHPPGSRRRRPPRAGAGARVHQLRAAPAGGADRRPDRLDLRRRADRRPEPDRRAQPRRASTASSAATCWRSIATARSSSTRPSRAARKIKLPDERHGVLFVFRVFSRMSYALILSVKEPVARRRPLHPAVDSQAARSGRADRLPHRPRGDSIAALPVPTHDRPRRTCGVAAPARDARRRPRGGARAARRASARREAVLAASTAARKAVVPAGGRRGAGAQSRRRSTPRLARRAGTGSTSGGDEARDVVALGDPRYPRALLDSRRPAAAALRAAAASSCSSSRRSRSSAAATRRRRASTTRAPSPPT